MAFETSISLDDSKYTYQLADSVKKYTLRDMTFVETKIGNWEFTRLLEAIPNSGDGFMMRIIVNKTLDGFKMSITDKSGLRHVNIFKSDEHAILQDKFYFQMDTFVDRGIFTKIEK
jgi:hypothetical protein